MKITTMTLGFLGTNCYIIEIGNKECIIFDAGANGKKLIEFLEKEELTPIYLFLTHGHFDHIGAVKEVRDRYKNMKVVIHKYDEERLYDEEKSMSKNFKINIGNQGKADIVLQNETSFKVNDELTMGIIYTPGHTEGGVCYLINDYILTGDTLFKGEVGRTDLYGGNYNKLLNSLKKLKSLNTDYIVCPGHGERSTLNFEKQHNPYMMNV